MKTFTWILTAALLSITGAVAAEPAQSKATPTLEKLKSLAGEWETKAPDGKPMRVTFQVVSGGTAVMQTDHGEEQMVTLYHPDGDRLILTHYCSADNQPRMSATPPAGVIKALDFSFLDATNLPSPNAGHMHKMVMTFQAKDQFTQEWTWKKGPDESVEKFVFQRRK